MFHNLSTLIEEVYAGKTSEYEDNSKYALRIIIPVALYQSERHAISHYRHVLDLQFSGDQHRQGLQRACGQNIWKVSLHWRTVPARGRTAGRGLLRRREDPLSVA